MCARNNDFNRRRIAELQAEIARLRESLTAAKAERKELLDSIIDPLKEEDLPTEDEYIQLMKNHVSGSGMKFLEELGLLPRKAT